MGLSELQHKIGDTVIKILILIQCIIFAALYIHAYLKIKMKVNAEVTLYLKTIMSITLIFVSAYAIRYLLVLILYDMNDKSNAFIAFEITLKDLLFVIGHSLFNLLMLLRLYFVFTGSTYALSKQIITSLFTFWCVITLINGIYFITTYYVEESLLNDYFFFALVLLDIIYGIVLIVIFSRKLTEMGMLNIFEPVLICLYILQIIRS